MDRSERFSDAVAAWVAGSEGAETASRVLAATMGIERVILVEGVSDRAAVLSLAELQGRDLEADGLVVVPIGGATSVGGFVRVLGEGGLRLRLSGLCDAGEERAFRHRLGASATSSPDRDAVADHGVYVCEADLEDELIRALGIARAEEVVAREGDLAAFRVFQNQPHQRGRPVDQQLRRFVGTLSGRKERYGRAFVTALDPAEAPRPLTLLLSRG